MPRHLISIDEAKAFLKQPHRIELASSHGKGSSKRIAAVLDGVWDSEPEYIVTVHGEEVYSGLDLSDAIETYNSHD